MEINANLQNAFRFNAIFSTVCALTLIALTDFWSAHFASINNIYILLSSVGLFVFAGYLLWFSSRKQQPRLSVLAIIASDWLYVIAALVILLLAFNSLSFIAIVFLLVTAFVVALAAEWQRRAAFC